eukprot:CCRYP_018175-RA/>CCRYP_018175-RA protein AED:0.34 eAED:0.47 QI:0/0/0.5/1/0/0/2/156/60
MCVCNTTNKEELAISTGDEYSMESFMPNATSQTHTHTHGNETIPREEEIHTIGSYQVGGT